ncbi:MAG TPA: hypothetical protein VGB14_19090 [Acidimicrobiales bacterium]|jgi:hypothetical protein
MQDADRPPPPDLSEVYDEATLAALDAWGRPPAEDRRHRAAPSRPVRRGAATGALLSGLVLGVRDVFEDERDEEVVLEEDAPGPDPGQAVVVHLVPFDPAASVAVVRPWLLRSAR